MHLSSWSEAAVGRDVQIVLGRRPNAEHVTVTHCNCACPLRARMDPKLKAGDRNSQQRLQNSMGTAFHQQRQQSCQKAKSLHPVCQMLQKRHPQDKFRRNEPHGHSVSTTTPAFVEKDQIAAPNASKAISTGQVSKRKTHGDSVSTINNTANVHGAKPNLQTTSTWGTTSPAISGRGNYCQTLLFIPIFSLPFLAVPFLSYMLHLAIMTAQNLPARMPYALFREVWRCELHTVS